LCETGVGGVVLFARNILSDAQAGRLTRAMAARSRECTGRRLLVAVDAEGGQVMRLGPDAGFTATFSAEELGESNDFTLTELEARRIARVLKSAGINWNLAPVVDVGCNPKNPVIVGAGRSFSADPLLVTAHARAVILGLHAEGVLTALKHFPGHGSSHGDSHKGFVDVTDTADRCPELTPYRMLIAERLADGIMTAHVFNRALDPEFPAPLPRAQGAARRRLSRERPRRPSGSSRTEQRFDLVPTGQRRLGAAPCARERRSCAGESQRIRERARLAQRHGEARVERVSRGGRVHDRHWQRGDADLAVGRAGQRAL